MTRIAFILCQHTSSGLLDLVPYMTIHEELQGPLRCDPTTTQNCHESNLKKQQEVNLAKKTATLESSSANRREQRCTSAEQSISEPSHLGMAKNGTDGLHMGVHARAHMYTHVCTHTCIHFYVFAIICTKPLESCIHCVFHIAVLLTNLLAFMSYFGLPGRILSQLLLPLVLYFYTMLQSRQR